MQRASLQGPNVPNTLRHGEDMRVVAPRPGAPQERSVLDQAPAVFAGMEEVRKNKQLKSPPCYFELARKKGLDTEVVGQRGRRDLLRVCAQQNNLLADIHPELVKVIGPHIISEGRGDTNCRPWMSWLLRPLSGGIPQHIPTHVSDGV